jgi:ribosomal protein S18 acetylase RimI-like enzyme
MSRVRGDAMKIQRIQVDEIAVVRPLWEALNELHGQLSSNFKEHFNRFTFEQRIAALRDRNSIAVFVAGGKKYPLGYCMASIQASTGEIDSIFVLPEHRGRGVGDGLMGAAESWLRSQNVSKIRVCVAEGNETVMDFYQKRGFRHRFTVLERS